MESVTFIESLLVATITSMKNILRRSISNMYEEYFVPQKVTYLSIEMQTTIFYGYL